MITRSTLLALAVMLVLGAVASGAPSWNAPVQLSTGDRAVGPQLALNAGGEALVVWDQEVGADCPAQPAALSCVHVVTAAARDRGSEAWQPPIEIARPGVGAAPRAALDPAGNGAIAWVHDIGRDRVLQATYRHGSTGTWPEPNDVSEAGLEIRNHEIALDAVGNAVVVWGERPLSHELFDLHAAVRSSATGAWGAPARLSSLEWRLASGPRLAVSPSGVAVVVWVDWNDVVRITRADLPAGPWEPSVAITGSTRPRKVDPRVAINAAGDTAVVWVREASATNESEIFAAFRTRGEGWISPYSLGPARTPSGAPQVAVDDAGNVVVVWLAPFGVAAATRSPSGAWTRTLTLSTLATASDPHLTISAAGNAVAVWTTEDNGVVQARIRPGASGVWQPQVDVSGSEASGQGVAMDAASTASSVWNRMLGQRVVVEIAELAGNGPVLERLRVPRVAMVVRVRRPFSVRPVAWAARLAGGPHWHFGDGSQATGRRVAHSYSRTGRFTVTVSQADAAGEVSMSTAIIRVIGARVHNVRPPSIRGTPRVGRTLLCLRGAWSGSPPIRFAYGWRRDGQVTAVKRARYRLGRDDAGSLIACEVVATNPAGSAHAISGVVGVER
jgi:hypothetical protein